MKKENLEYFLGLDIGTDSVGYAATDNEYKLLKFKGEPAWGVTLFDEAQLNTERRTFRTARRRLDRRQQRVHLIQELFANEIAKIDKEFYHRIANSRLLRDEAGFAHTLFDDIEYTDVQYYKKYPTIHHLLLDLMTNPEPHDVRLVYLACVWLVAHRGHFLSEVNQDNIAGLTDFHAIWNDLIEYIRIQEDNVLLPWKENCENAIADILKIRSGITEKFKKVSAVMFSDGRCPKMTEQFPYNCEQMIKALCGSTITAKTLFNNDAFEDIPSFSLSDSDENLAEIFGNIGDDAELLKKMKSIYDWSLLVDILGNETAISAAKVIQYNQHKSDLRVLKRIVRQYLPNEYNNIFRLGEANNYVAYTMHNDDKESSRLKRTTKEDFSKYILNKIKNIEPNPDDEETLTDIKCRLSAHNYLPKQHDTDNRVIPHQLYLYELKTILKTASVYLPFLIEKDKDGLTASEKIISIFTFRIPYYVGPLNHPTGRKDDHAWIVRKAGRILPWNFDDMVDLDASEEAFIHRMTNTCTYLPNATVLPKESLLYQKFMVLNEINNLKIDGENISVQLKQSIFTNVFMKYRKITRKRIQDYLLSNGNMLKGQTITGIDDQIRSSLSSYFDFRSLFDNKVLTEAEVERIIERKTCSEDKYRFKRWLKKEFPMIKQQYVDYIARLNYKGFGRLSRELLTGIEITSVDGIRTYNIIQAMWETNENLMELLSDKYDFIDKINACQKEYYQDHPTTLEGRMEQMHLLNAVKRPVIRTLDITADVVKAFGTPPAKIFVEITRGADQKQKNKRTKTRTQQLIELYSQCKDEDVRVMQHQLEELGDNADTLLQGDRLFLYYLQLGKCAYTGRTLDLNLLKGDSYNIEHIYPRKQVKDDSILNNEVLVLSEENGQKSDNYPISSEIRTKMRPYWERLKNYGLISDEKFKRLTRSTPFTVEEKMGFIQRQLTETSQSTKAVAELLKERYPNSEIVYVKARLTSEFRQAFDCLKSRTFNDLHHAKDAYLNVITGNVYNMKFSKRWFDVNSDYSVKTEVLYSHRVICGGKIVWNGAQMLDIVKDTLAKNNAHITKYAFCRKGGYFDQMPVPPATGLIPLKRGLPTEIYGGYNKAKVSFFIPVHYHAGKKSDTIIMPVELLYSKKFMEDLSYATEYAQRRIEQITGKKPDNVIFPMGMRIWKINTMLSLDGFRVVIAGSANAGKCLIAQPFMVFSASSKIEYYIKKLEVLTEKLKARPKYIFDPQYDKVTEEENIALYDLYIEKFKHTIYKYRWNNPLKLIEDGREKFLKLSVQKQAGVLLNIHATFGRVSGGCDFTEIGGPAYAAATVNFSSSVSNWKKHYNNVKIVDTSSSGLWGKYSENLLDIL